MNTPSQDEWTVERWRLEPRWRPVDVDEPLPDLAPPLWKDLTVAAVTAGLLWLVAVALLG
ncbi:MAG TPA: hypothetical protein VD833_14130 [Vicinamibacterales bacterium]|nr:hypothetical protein [Vicinamibacterales bacterium]